MWVHCPRASNGLLPRRSNLVGYVRWDARSDRFPPCQTIIPTAFRSQSGLPTSPCKSLSREKKILLTRASEERALLSLSEPAASHVCLSAVGPTLAGPDIHSLSHAPAV